MSVERLHFAPGRTAYNSMTAAEHVCRYVFAAQACAGRRVLDVACGEGYGSALLADAGAARVLGIDIAADAVAMAQARFARDGVTFLAGDAETLPALLADQPPFDLVISFETIEHVIDVQTFLEGIRQILAPGGMVLISAPNEITAEGVSANPFHRRAYTLDGFLSATEAVLGPARQVWLGAPILGFGIFAPDPALAGNDSPDLTAMLRGAPAGPSRVLPAQREHRLDARNASFFVAAWGGEAAMALTAAPVSHPAWIEQYQALQWLRLENARLLHAADATATKPTGPSDRQADNALADLRRAALLERLRLEQALADLDTQRAAAHSLRVGHNALLRRFAAQRDSLVRFRDQRDATGRRVSGLQPYIAVLRDQRDAARKDVEALQVEVRALRAELASAPRVTAPIGPPDGSSAPPPSIQPDAAVGAEDVGAGATMAAPAGLARRLAKLFGAVSRR